MMAACCAHRAARPRVHYCRPSLSREPDLSLHASVIRAAAFPPAVFALSFSLEFSPVGSYATTRRAFITDRTMGSLVASVLWLLLVIIILPPEFTGFRRCDPTPPSPIEHFLKNLAPRSNSLILLRAHARASNPRATMPRDAESLASAFSRSRMRFDGVQGFSHVFPAATWMYCQRRARASRVLFQDSVRCGIPARMPRAGRALRG